MTARGRSIEVEGELPAAVPRDRGMLAAIEELAKQYTSPYIPELPPLQGGVMGYLGYDVVREVEHLPNVPHDDRGMPDGVMGVIGSLAAFDHWRQRVYMIESVRVLGVKDLDAAYAAASAAAIANAERLAQPLEYTPVEPPRADDVLPEARSSMPGGSYQRAVEAAKEYVRSGDIFQVVLSQRFDVELEADPFDVYRVLRQVNPSPYMYFLHHGDVTLVGSSPEPMVHVDLARNDVGRVAKFGTVHVDELMTLERYSHVMHLTSQVSGDLVEGLGPIDVLRATLPAGTVSGAPKVRAMEIIDELEPVKRGPYAGVVGYIDWSGNLDTAIAIRTMFIGPTGASLQAGAGIVADSIPEDEDLECANKARGLLVALPAAARMTRNRKASGRRA